MRMILPSDCNACLRILWVDCKQAVSLSQLLCTWLVLILAGAVYNIWDFSGTFLRARRLISMFYCNLLLAGVKKQVTKKTVTLCCWLQKNIFFDFAKTLYVHFVPIGDHLAIAFLFLDWKKVQKKVRLTFSPFLNQKRWASPFPPFLLFFTSPLFYGFY
jgi:hypothetical protein